LQEFKSIDNSHNLYRSAHYLDDTNKVAFCLTIIYVIIRENKNLQ